MNYQKHYDLLINRVKSQDRKKYKKSDIRYVYYERHHIVPASFFVNSKRKGSHGWLEGNPDTKENIVLLTPEEHFLAHQLLAKIYPNNHGLIKAVNMMCNSSPSMAGKRNNKRYAWIRRKLAEALSAEKTGKPSPLKGKESPLKGRVGASKGKPSPKKGIRTGPNGQKGTKRGPSKFKGIPSGRKGIPSDKKGIPSGKKGSIRGPNKNPMTIVQCPHCAKNGGISQMKRYHFSNCKNFIIGDTI